MSSSRRLGFPALMVLLALGVGLPPAPAEAQGSAQDYARAESLRDRLDGLMINTAHDISWIGDSHRFTYRRTVAGGSTFLLVDADALERRPAFDHGRLATALSEATGESYTEITLPFTQFELDDDEGAIDFEIDDRAWRCGLTAYDCTASTEEPASSGRGGRGGGRGGRGGGAGGVPDDEPLVSPDGEWEAVVENFNVAIRRAGNEELTMKSTDGSEGDYYEPRSLVWSPDSKKLAAYRVTPGYRRLVHYVESSPDDQLQPKYSNRVYLKPGDRLEVERPVLFNLESGRQVVVSQALFPNAYSQTNPSWWDDSRAFYFEYNQRGHQAFKVIEVDASTGEPRALVDEQEETFFSYYTTLDRHFTANGEEIIWASERDGWKHLYLYDGRTGQVKNQITRGDWVVRELDDVDEENRLIYFRASGMNPGEDPYFIHHYRIGFDGTGLIDLTEAEGEHTVSWSEDKAYYLDTWSQVDRGPVSQLRRTRDRAVLMELERADLVALEDASFRPPEPFVAKGRDGVTDIWGIIVKPSNFDPERRYPVIENIYAGPHNNYVPKGFQAFSSMMSLAELGFIVVQIDGMGTANRSKAFHDVAWKNIKDAGFPDRILWHQAVAARYPWYDTSSVGIYGTSAGGQSSLGALLFHPEFYHVAVSAAGCHDNRMDKISWNEQWMGWPVGPEYAESSNVDNAWRLQGEVLLVVGELDTNVPPASTLQVADALIKADKDFDLLFLPGAGHTSGGEYGERKRWDYLVEHLLDVDPPDRNAVVAAPPQGSN